MISTKFLIVKFSINGFSLVSPGPNYFSVLSPTWRHLTVPWDASRVNELYPRIWYLTWVDLMIPRDCTDREWWKIILNKMTTDKTSGSVMKVNIKYMSLGLECGLKRNMPDLKLPQRTVGTSYLKNSLVLSSQWKNSFFFYKLFPPY